MTNDEMLEAARTELNRADSPATTINKIRLSLGAIIIAMDYLIATVADQQRQIEELIESAKSRNQ